LVVTATAALAVATGAAEEVEDAEVEEAAEETAEETAEDATGVELAAIAAARLTWKSFSSRSSRIWRGRPLRSVLMRVLRALSASSTNLYSTIPEPLELPLLLYLNIIAETTGPA
jgi:hypothetical protein